jgi:predicted amidohydrolase YtcJ
MDTVTNEAQVGPPAGLPTPPATTTLYRGGFLHGTGGAHGVAGATDHVATALVVDGERIAWIGSDEDAAGHADGVDAVVELDGALVTPAFVDSHVHMSATGLGLRSVELTDAVSLRQVLDRIGEAARKRGGRPLYAPNWDERGWPEQRPPTGQELDRATYGGVVYCPRVDGHSAVISSALAAASGARSQPGWHDNGLVTRQAHHAAREVFSSGISAAARRADIEAAMRAAARAGIGLVHENGGPTLSSSDDFADVLAAGQRGDGPQVIGYWAELVGDEHAARTLARLRGARGLGGDLNIDGSIGSRTASLREPYADDADHHGHPYLSVEQVRDHVAACSLAGLQAGFHVIGDAGADTVIAGLKAAAGLVGVATVVAARHRLEHLEMVDDDGIRALAALGVTASVQPAFHSLWGGPDGMYAARLGEQRAQAMNRFAAMQSAGLALALGSDTPVTPFAPWAAIRDCVNHHDLTQRLPAATAFRAHTRGGWRAAGIDNRGFLGLGQPASFALWSVATGQGPGTLSPDCLPDLSPGVALPTNLRTVIHGRTVFDRLEAS